MSQNDDKKQFVFSEVLTLNSLIEELVYGSIAGLAICLAGHPFDTIKTRMQMDNTSLFKTTKLIITKEGPLAFYKGLGGPLASVPALNAIVFSSFELTRKYFESSGQISCCYVSIAGGVAGLTNTIIVGPSELVKCKMQMQKSNKGYKNSWDCAKDIYKRNGVRGLMQGGLITAIREVPAYMVQFSVYEFLKREVFNPGSALGPAITPSQGFGHRDFRYKPTSIDGWRAMISGGIAGWMCWLFSFPPDIIKTKIQCKPIGHYKSILYDGGIITVSKNVYKHHGILGFFNGFSAISGRALIANAIGFWTWEFSRKMIDMSDK